MKKKEWNQGLDHIDYDLVEKYTLQREKLKGRQHTKSVWLRVGALAACLVLIFGAVVFLPRMQNDVPKNEGTTPDDNGQTEFTILPNVLSGLSSVYLVNLDTADDGFNADKIHPSNFWRYLVGEFCFNVKAKVVDAYPDEYYNVQHGRDYELTPYRLIKMEITETLYGEDMPQYFLYLMPACLYVDMSVYDSLLISMKQCGTENYVLKNVTQNQMEVFDLPIFGDYADQCDMGRIIAFNNGVFDETLWQTESWSYGYQFGKQYLDDPQHEKLVVKRGDTEATVIANIKQKIEQTLEKEENVFILTPETLNVKTQAAKDALEYVKPFQNGVFIQTYRLYASSDRVWREVVYRRYINGCPTQETITIDLVTEEVTYSDVRYTEEDISKLENISVYLADMAKEYSENIPKPPHIDSYINSLSGGKKLVRLNLIAWYVKVDDKLYGVIKTYWQYKGHENGCMIDRAYDTSYILFDMSEKTVTELERDDLVEIVGTWNIPTKAYGFIEFLE